MSTSSGLLEVLGHKFVGHDGKPLLADKLAANDLIGIYFSAHWCGPCRGFTPVLGEVYKQIRALGRKFEVVFASSDSDASSFQDYFDSMPWAYALPFGGPEKTALSKRYNVRGIPTLVILDGKGQTVAIDGRAGVMQHREKAFDRWIVDAHKSKLSRGMRMTLVAGATRTPIVLFSDTQDENSVAKLCWSPIDAKAPPSSDPVLQPSPDRSIALDQDDFKLTTTPGDDAKGLTCVLTNTRANVSITVEAENSEQRDSLTAAVKGLIADFEEQFADIYKAAAVRGIEMNTKFE